MQYVRSGLATIIPLLLLHLINPEPVDYEDVTCGTLFGDGRYCLNYTSVGLGAVPPQGKNVTTILHLKGNQIRAVGASAFKHEKLLVKLDLSNNRIAHIDPSAFNHLSLLKEVWLGANPYLCETSICPFRKWLLANTNLVKDITQVTCNNSPYKDEQIIKLQSEPLCRNSTIHHGFEINTDTLIGFLILIAMVVIIVAVTSVRERMAGRVVVPEIWANRFGLLAADIPPQLPPREEYRTRVESVSEDEHVQQSTSGL